MLINTSLKVVKVLPGYAEVSRSVHASVLNLARIRR